MGLLKPEICEQHRELYPLLRESLRAIEAELRDLLEEQSIPLHSLRSRIKTEESLQNKLSRPDRTYREIWDVTDLIGLRVVAPFEDTLEEVAALIEKSFQVDLENSQNKIQFHDHERFGYRSLHYICQIPRRLGGLHRLPPHARFEIQIRTVLQDAWAEIEHDLGYKASHIASPSLRRRFSRISSLFEIADEELVAIRRELRSYIDSHAERDWGEDTHLDHISLAALVKHPEIERLDHEIASLLHRDRSPSPFFPDYLLQALRAARITDGQDVLRNLLRLRESVLRFVPVYFEFARESWGMQRGEIENVPSGYGLLFLAHVIILHEEPLALNKVRRLTEFYQQLDYPEEIEKAREVASILVRAVETDPAA